MNVVEVFIEKDIEKLIYDGEQLEDWKAKVTELGLEGQTQLSNKDEKPIPFTRMKKTMEIIFETLCPLRAEVDKYESSVIPLEVLGAISLSNSERYFERIEIWYDNINPSPVVVGYTDNHKYLIARWGEEKMNINALYEIALSQIIKQIKFDSSNILVKAKENFNNAEHLAEKKLNGDWINWTYF